MKLNLLVLTLLLTSLTTDILPAAKRPADEAADEEPATKLARTGSDSSESEPTEEAAKCCICLAKEKSSEAFISAARARQLLTCADRTLHEQCLRRWLLTNQSCPLCRAPAVVVHQAAAVPVAAPISLHQAVRQGNLAAVQALLATPGINVNVINPGENSALHTAVLLNNLAIIQLLLATPGINVNLASIISGATPLHWAVEHGNLPSVIALLAVADINVNATDAHGATPLHMAALQGHVAVVQALLAAPGINVNVANALGSTPLHVAASRGHVAVVQALLATPGINVNPSDDRRWTPLHYAAYLGRVAVVQTLLDAGADRAIRNRAGQTAADADVASTPEIRAMIEQYQPAAAGGAAADDGAAAAAAE